jgi:hypothetical protein
MVLVLKNFRADLEGGTRTIRATIIYGPLLKNNDNALFQNEFQQYYSYGNTIFITNNRGGKKSLPLQVGFTKGNAVLNDGSPGNTLELVIANKNWPASNLPLSTDSEFVISFEMSADINKEGAVATDTQIKGISITTSSDKWNVPSEKDRTEWPVTPKSGTNQLASDEVIKLNIANLVTNHSSGSGYLYVRYRNIPNYPDGQFVVPIEKTPLWYRDKKVDNGWEKRVGIGINDPSAKLHLNGNIRLSGNIENGANKRVNLYTNTGAGDSDAWIELWGSASGDTSRTGELALAGKYINFSYNSTQSSYGSVGMRLASNGNVGIGTTTRSEKLHVSGNAKVTGNAEVNGNLGIGTTTPSAKLHVNGGDAIFSNQVGIGTTSPSAKLHVNGGDAIFSNQVGIGTTTPSAKLHVEGNIRLSGNIENGANGKINLYTNTGAGDSDAWIELWGSSQNTDSTRTGELALTGKYIDFRYNSTSSSEGTVGMRLACDGNVGIGTTTPSAKLDVHGDFHIKGSKPMEYKVYECSQDNPTITTSYSLNTWIAIVAGFSGFDQSGNNWQASGIKVLPRVDSSNNWVVDCDLGYIDKEKWKIAILFIRRQLANI